MMRPTVLFPILGAAAWLVTGVVTYGSPIFWVWMLESIGVVIMGRLALRGIM